MRLFNPCSINRSNFGNIHKRFSSLPWATQWLSHTFVNPITKRCFKTAMSHISDSVLWDSWTVDNTETIWNFFDKIVMIFRQIIKRRVKITVDSIPIGQFSVECSSTHQIPILSPNLRYVCFPTNIMGNNLK